MFNIQNFWIICMERLEVYVFCDFLRAYSDYNRK